MYKGLPCSITNPIQPLNYKLVYKTKILSFFLDKFLGMGNPLALISCFSENYAVCRGETWKAPKVLASNNGLNHRTMRAVRQ